MKAITLTSDNFKTEVLESNVPVLVDFWAAWCGPCQMLGPIVERVAESATTFKVGKVDVQEYPDFAATYGVMNIPTLLVFKGGKVVNKSVGVISEEEILALVK